MTIKIVKKPGENINSLIKRFNKQTKNIKEECLERQFYKKPSQKRYEKEKRRLYKIAHPKREEVDNFGEIS